MRHHFKNRTYHRGHAQILSIAEAREGASQPCQPSFFFSSDVVHCRPVAAGFPSALGLFCVEFNVRTPRSTIRSCIKAAAYVKFFKFLVRLLFKYGFYLRTAYLQSPESAKLVKAVWHM